MYQIVLTVIMMHQPNVHVTLDKQFNTRAACEVYKHKKGYVSSEKILFKCTKVT